MGKVIAILYMPSLPRKPLENTGARVSFVSLAHCIDDRLMAPTNSGIYLADCPNLIDYFYPKLKACLAERLSLSDVMLFAVFLLFYFLIGFHVATYLN